MAENTYFTIVKDFLNRQKNEQLTFESLKTFTGLNLIYYKVVVKGKKNTYEIELQIRKNDFIVTISNEKTLLMNEVE